MMKSHSNLDNSDAYVDGSDAYVDGSETTRSKILGEADRLIHNDRQSSYGPPHENFARVAAGWAVLLGVDVTPAQVAACMAWLKMCRLVHDGQDWDGYVDGCGYMALAGELAGAKRRVKDEA